MNMPADLQAVTPTTGRLTGPYSRLLINMVETIKNQQKIIAEMQKQIDELRASQQ